MLSCFKAYDIRGRLGDELNEDIARRIGRAFAYVLGAARVVVGRDCRASSAALMAATVEGLVAAGAEVAGAFLTAAGCTGAAFFAAGAFLAGAASFAGVDFFAAVAVLAAFDATIEVGVPFSRGPTTRARVKPEAWKRAVNDPIVPRPGAGQCQGAATERSGPRDPRRRPRRHPRTAAPARRSHTARVRPR